VHVLELFERGILDRQSIRFLFDLGLVPAISPSKSLLTNAASDVPVSSDELALVPTTTTSRAIEATTPLPQTLQHSINLVRQRSIEASAIRSHLEQQEQNVLIQSRSKSQLHSAEAGPSILKPWLAEHHPLSLSRYQREFDEVRLLSSGSFGQVFHVTSKMDGRDYAVKRVAFRALGYSRESVQQVIREVLCLAVCDHPNVVRYYTSWLEPSWMTGGSCGYRVAGPCTDHQKLLTDIGDLVSSESLENKEQAALNLSQDLDAYFRGPDCDESLLRRRRRHSLDSHSDIFDRKSVSERKVDEDTAYDDSIIEWDCCSNDNNAPTDPVLRPRIEDQNKSSNNSQQYHYQICLFIQMQLCHAATLADWIRERNKLPNTGIASRIGPVTAIFKQIVQGLSHVHKKGIVHRDLKPANIFAAVDDSCVFKIGDFGLSKLIELASSSPTSQSGRCTRSVNTNASSNNHRHQYQTPTPYGLLTNGDATGAIYQDPALSDVWDGQLTAGVGTASYAAPEQITSMNYGKEADIYSLGLILLELSCQFSTDHERLQTFQDCRKDRVLPAEMDQYPILKATILRCTHLDKSRRPSADELVSIEDFENARHSCPDGNLSLEVLLLQRQLSERDSELEKCKRLLAEKDATIRYLQQQLAESSASCSASSALGLVLVDNKPKLDCPASLPSFGFAYNEFAEPASSVCSSSDEDEL
jgi:serine/threonine protein kinase